MPALQRLRQLLGDARRRGLGDLLAVVEDRLVGVGRDREAQAAGELDRAQHADRVLAEADVRIADGPDEARLEVLEAAHVVDHREVGDVVEEPVDREVPPQRVLAGGAERRCRTVIRSSGASRIQRLGPPPEGRDLDDLSVGEEDVGEPESPADQPAVAEEPPHRLRMGVGADVEVLGHALEQEVADAPADEVRLVPGGREPVEDLQRVRVDLPAGDRVLAARPDARRRGFRGVFDGGCPGPRSPKSYR